MVVDNIVIHHCENFHSQTRCILIWKKKEKYADLNRWTVRNLKILKSCQICYFYVAQNNTNFVLKFLIVVGLDIVYKTTTMTLFNKIWKKMWLFFNRAP